MGTQTQGPGYGLSIPQEIMRHLLVAEVTDLIWTAINGLGSSSPFRVQAAAELLLAVINQHGAKLETVRGWGTTQGWAAVSVQGHPPGQDRSPELGPSRETQSPPCARLIG